MPPMPRPSRSPLPSNLSTQQPSGQPQIALNPQVFEELIRSHGIRMIHARPVPCPKVKDLYSGEHDPSCNECFNGFLYYGHKEFVGAFVGNTNQRQFLVNGTWDLDQAQIIIPTKYNDGSELDVQFFDQIILPDFTVRYYQRVEHSQGGIDRLHFPAKEVDFIRDANGRQYEEGADFIINQSGYIEWISTTRPGYDITLDRGIIYSINYYCKPVFTAIGLPHQLRVSQSLEEGKSVQTRFPQLVIVRKDFIPFDPSDKVGPPDRPEPRDGGL
jgi:hypothetical protein